MTQISLIDLPQEVLQNILVYVDVYSLLQVSRTSHILRNLCCDPILRKVRLAHVRHDLKLLLLNRLPKTAISPPNAWIWLSMTNVLSRSISRSLVKIRLNHSLERRPCIEDLVQRAILPECCSQLRAGRVSPVIIGTQEEVRKSRLKDKLGRLIEHRPPVDRVVEMNILPAECASGSNISPKLVETRRRVMKENLKDGLRAWVKSRAIDEQRKQAEEYDNCAAAAGINVKAIVRKFSARKAVADSELGLDSVGLEKRQARARWGREVELERRRQEKRVATIGICSQPERAHVLGLRKFWEGVIKTAAG